MEVLKKISQNVRDEFYYLVQIFKSSFEHMSPSVVWKTLLVDSANTLKSLWVFGLALLSIFLCSSFSLFREEKLEWAQYLLLGTLFPLATLSLTLIEKHFKYTECPLDTIKIGLGLFSLVISFYYLFYFKSISAHILILSLISWTLMLGIFAGSAFADRRLVQDIDIPAGVIGFLIVVMSWAVSIKLLWWDAFLPWLEHSYFRILIFSVAFLLVSINLLVLPKRDLKQQAFRLSLVANTIAIGIFGLASVRIEHFTYDTFMHWSVYIGPAEMVRQGGWLLWDVPSQYGFLNLLLLSTFPANSTWQALYIIDSLLYFLVSTILFLFLQSLRPGIVNYLFAFLITFASVFMVTGWAEVLSGPHLLPSTGVFRFFWCYVLLVILFWHFKANPRTDKPLWLGTIAWLIGTLWSAESAVYCASIWLPAYLCLVLQKSVASTSFNEGTRFHGKALFWLLLPPTCLGAIIGAIIVFYRLQLRHSPDWFMFFEYAFAFKGGFGALPIDPAGAVWILLLVLSLLSTIIVLAINEFVEFALLGLTAGFWGALWATSSYFINRSHDFVITALSPFWVGCIALSIYLLDRIVKTKNSVWLMRMSVIPLLTVLLTAGFANNARWTNYLIYLTKGYCQDVRRLLPTMDKSLVALLESANAGPEDPIIWLDRNEALPLNYPFIDGKNDVVRNDRAWLPVSPSMLFGALSPDRRQLYISRFVSRFCLSGWLLESKLVHPDMPWLFEQVGVTHTAVETYENAEWKLTWYAVKRD